MYDSEMRKDCPMRGNLGNCSLVGGFCMNAVSDEICEAVHNAYYHGFYNALKEQEEYVSVPFSWLVKFCTHIDFVEPLSDAEREVAWRQKLKQQFGIDFS